MVAQVRYDGRRCGCFSGCRGAIEWVRLYAPNLVDLNNFRLACFKTRLASVIDNFSRGLHFIFDRL